MNQQSIQFDPTVRPSPGGRRKNFERAQRHSRRVRWLKIGVPVTAVLLVLVFALWSWWSSREGFIADFDTAAIADGKLAMTNATLNGFTRENLPYSLSAERAVQEIGGTGRVELEAILAHVPLEADIWADIEAATGLYDNEKKLLDITSPMNVTTTNGLNAVFHSAHINVQNGILTTADPVRIEMEGSSLTADSMEVLERGRLIVLDGRVRLSIAGGMNRMGKQNGG